MRRLLTFLAVLVLAAAVWWIVRPPVALDDLGPAMRLVTRDGVPLILVGDAAGDWRALPQSARTPEDGYLLPPGLRGRPFLDAQGGVVALHAHGVVRLVEGKPELEMPLPDVLRVDDASPGMTPAAPRAPGREVQLVGLDAADEPVLLWQSPEGSRLFVRVRIADDWRLLELPDGEPASPVGGPGARLVLSPAQRALAFLGRDGWEAWLYETTPVRRRVASGCSGAQALFTPDGAALVLDGKVKGLWRLELEEDTLHFMAEGNLGHHERIPFSAGFRQIPTDDSPGIATLMVAPQSDYQGFLQIVQTHLSGGGRWSFGGGFLHHYEPAVSPDGRWLTYVQAQLDADVLDEELYLFDFEHPDRPALALARRTGGRPGQGPAFVGDGSVLVFIARGRVQRFEVPVQ